MPSSQSGSRNGGHWWPALPLLEHRWAEQSFRLSRETWLTLLGMRVRHLHREHAMANEFFFSFKWMMRVIALIELFMLAIANLVRMFMSSSADIGSAPLSLDSQTKIRSSSKDRTHLLFARFQKACVQYLHPWLYPYLPGFLYT